MCVSSKRKLPYFLRTFLAANVSSLDDAAKRQTPPRGARLDAPRVRRGAREVPRRYQMAAQWQALQA